MQNWAILPSHVSDSPLPLPSTCPQDRWSLFDGVCNLCAWAVQFIIERATPAGSSRLPPSSPTRDAASLAQHGLDPGQLDTFVLVEDGRAYTKSTAALKVSRLPLRPLVILSYLYYSAAFCAGSLLRLHCPKPLLLVWQKDSCLMPTPELRAKFLG